MASEQIIRRYTNTSDEQEAHVEKDIVPKMTSHFESLAEKVKGMDVAGGEEGRAEKGREAHEEKSKSSQAEVNAEKQKDSDMVLRGEEGEADRERSTNKERPSLEEISKYRAIAQQNSMEAIRSAEERFAKAKELGVSALHDIKESAGHGLGAATAYATEKGEQAKDTIVHGVRATSQYVSEKGGVAKDTALEKGQHGYVAAKDTLVGTGKDAVDYTVQTAEQAKDYALQKVAESKDVVMSAGESAVHYVEGKAVAAKDVVADAGHSAVEFAGKKVATAKEAAVGTGESAKEYTAEEKEAAEKEVEAKKSTEKKEEIGGEETREEQQDFETGREGRENGGGVLGAIGETIVEIAQTAKELVIGPDQTGADDKVGHEASATDYSKQGQPKQEKKNECSFF